MKLEFKTHVFNVLPETKRSKQAIALSVKFITAVFDTLTIFMALVVGIFQLNPA